MQRITNKDSLNSTNLANAYIWTGGTSSAEYGPIGWRNGNSNYGSGGEGHGQHGILTFDSANSPNARTGDFTRGKRKGVQYLIKVL